MTPLRRGALLALVPLLAAGCGGSSSSKSSGGAGRSADQILSDMTRALRDVRSYHLAGTQTDKDGRSALAGDVSADGSLHVRLDNGGKRAEIVVAGSQTFMRANRAFWNSEASSSGAKVARLLSDRWVKIPASGAGEVSRQLEEFAPRTLAHCLTSDTGTVTKRGAAQLDGRPVVVLADKGDKPGTSPGLLYVAATGPTLPLRAVQTGRERPGGHHEARCGGSDSSTRHSDVRLSAFDRPVRITAPKGALDLDKLAAASGGTA